MEIGNLVREYRKKAHMTAVELAKVVKVSQGTISHIETGKRSPSHGVLKRIMDILSIPQDIIELPTTKSSESLNIRNSVLVIDNSGFEIKINLRSKVKDNVKDEDIDVVNFAKDIYSASIKRFIDNNKQKILDYAQSDLDEAFEKLKQPISFDEADPMI
jgi:transcriptional regulator with XRE-family HTH domain